MDEVLVFGVGFGDHREGVLPSGQSIGAIMLNNCN
jgi:hypothetical protein